MRKTLRRSCDACAKSKLRCDLLSPTCSRCKKKTTNCVYANEPLSSILTAGSITARPGTLDSDNVPDTWRPVDHLMPLDSSIRALDPFDTYPQTRLPRGQVQRLIHHFLSAIAFQYYPLDLNTTSNPFVISWWPLALADPALFHVSLQTASWDIDSRTCKGFAVSNVLMADSVALVRAKIADSHMAIQDETMNAVITLAAIEFGKGNVDVCKMHVDGVKSMVKMRGGIGKVKLSNPLTARMVAWVSLILTQSPQFATQSDWYDGQGICPIPQWVDNAPTLRDHASLNFSHFGIDLFISDIFLRLRSIFQDRESAPLTTTNLHDLTCFVLHRILSWTRPLQEEGGDLSNSTLSISECIKYAIALYMLILHGPTYFSHAFLQHNLVLQLRAQIDVVLDHLSFQHAPITLWLLLVGLVASKDMSDSIWFSGKAAMAADTLGLYTWEHVVACLESILWYPTPHAQDLFTRAWEEVGITAIGLQT